MSEFAFTDAELQEHRDDAAALRVSTATVRRRNGYTTVGGAKVPNWTDVVVGSPFRLGGANSGSAQTRTVSIGGTEVQVAVRVGSFPVSVDDLADGDVIEVTGGENAGMFLEVVESAWQDQATARRVPVVQMQAPEGWPSDESSSSEASSSSSSS